MNTLASVSRMSSKKDSEKSLSPGKTYLRHRVQSYVEGVTNTGPSEDLYETEIPAEDRADFADKETVEVVEEVIEVSSISRGLFAETILGRLWTFKVSTNIIYYYNYYYFIIGY